MNAWSTRNKHMGACWHSSKNQHSGTFKLSTQTPIKSLLTNPWERIRSLPSPTGGGMIEVIEIDGARVSFAGDCFSDPGIYLPTMKTYKGTWSKERTIDSMAFHSADQVFLELKSQQFLEDIQDFKGNGNRFPCQTNQAVSCAQPR